MRGAIATLKCSVCHHLFRIEAGVAAGRENQHRWMVRSASTGDVFYFSDFEQLHRWLLEGKVRRDDAISRTGNKWTQLEDVGEFMPIFQVVESLHQLSGAPPETARARAHTPRCAQTDVRAPAAHLAGRLPLLIMELSLMG